MATGRPVTPSGEAPAWPWLVLLVALLAAALLLWAIAVGPGTRPAVRDSALATPGQIATHPDVFAGRAVTTGGEVRQLLGEHAFSVVGTEPATEPDLVVVARRPIVAPDGSAGGRAIGLDDFVRATGVVRRFDRAALEAETGLELGGPPFALLVGQPVLVAGELEVVPRGQPAARERLLVETIRRRASEVLGRRVTVAGVVARTPGPWGLVVTDADRLADEELLVVVPDGGRPSSAYPPGSRVRVSGVVRVFDLGAVERVSGRDVDGAALGGWAGRPMVVAEEIDAGA